MHHHTHFAASRRSPRPMRSAPWASLSRLDGCGSSTPHRLGAERCLRHCQPHIHSSAVSIRRGRGGSLGLLAACLGAAIAVHLGGRAAPKRAGALRHCAEPRARCKDWRFNGVHGTRACRQGWRQRGLVWSFLCTVLHRNNGVLVSGMGWARASARHSAGKCRAESGRTPPKAVRLRRTSSFRGQIPSLS